MPLLKKFLVTNNREKPQVGSCFRLYGDKTEARDRAKDFSVKYGNEFEVTEFTIPGKGLKRLGKKGS